MALFLEVSLKDELPPYVPGWMPWILPRPPASSMLARVSGDVYHRHWTKGVRR